ncbi:MAG: amidohydrolase family protein [Myxococcales bacterium]|nr:amidohydrolase family protein [Myxococcales bacterium]
MLGCKGDSGVTASPPPAPAAATTPAGPAWRPGYTRPPIIDMHTHISPAGLPRLATIMKDNGIALVVNLSGGSIGRGVEKLTEIQKTSPARFVSFFNVDWRYRREPGFGRLMAQSLELAVKRYGYKGLKISKALGLGVDDADGHLLPVDWPELDPLWAKAGELGVPVAIHTGDPKAFWEPVTPENERYDELNVHPGWSYAGGDFPSRAELLAARDRVVARHPETTFICVHLGNNPEDLDYVEKLLATYPNVVVDVAARVPEIGRHPADRVRALFVKYKTRIVFGTDLGVGADYLMLGSVGDVPSTMADVKPFYDAHWRFFEGTEKGIAHPTPIQGRWTIDAIGLPDDVLELLYYKNALRLLKMDAADLAPPPSPPPASSTIAP